MYLVEIRPENSILAALSVLSASGGLCPPDQGLCPWTPLGAKPPDPHYRLALRAIAMGSAISAFLLSPLAMITYRIALPDKPHPNNKSPRFQALHLADRAAVGTRVINYLSILAIQHYPGT